MVLSNKVQNQSYMHVFSKSDLWTEAHAEVPVVCLWGKPPAPINYTFGYTTLNLYSNWTYPHVKEETKTEV